MSQYYRPHRSRYLFDPSSSKPFKLSRSRIDVFHSCPRCFYLDRRLGVDRPPGFPFSLNSAVDTLLKKEFDVYRADGKPHPLMTRYGIDAVPAAHEKLDTWRENFKGVEYHHPATNLILTGAIDDLWIDSKGTYIVVDYKATSKEEEITALDQGWHISYKRQMEFYQWLLRHNGLSISSRGYFVYCNGIKDRDIFDSRLDFDITVIPHDGDDGWVEETVIAAHRCLCADAPPPAAAECDYCLYRAAVASVLKMESGLAQ